MRKPATQVMIRQGLRGPWDSEPEVPTLGAPAYTAFWALGGDRATGFGLGPIPWTALDAYATRHGIAGEEFTNFAYYLSTMDSIYLEHHREQKKDKKQADPSEDGFVQGDELV